MNTDLKLQHVDSDTLLLAYIERRLNFLLARFGPRIGRTTVRISATNSVHPGEITCRMTVDLKPFGPVTAEAVDTDAYSAIDRCSSRLARRCETKCARPRSLRSTRRSIRIPGSLPKAS